MYLLLSLSCVGVQPSPGVCLDNLQTVPMDESTFDAAYSAASSSGEVISLESPSPKRPEGLKDGVA